MGRTSTLDQHDGLRDFIADKWMSGCTNKEVAEAVAGEFKIDEPAVRTVQNWRQDSEVAEKIHRVMRERIARVVRKTDSAIDQLDFSQLTVDEIIKIRREFLPERDAMTDEKTDATQTAEDLFGAMEEDPELARKVAEAAARDE